MTKTERLKRVEAVARLQYEADAARMAEAAVRLAGAEERSRALSDAGVCGAPYEDDLAAYGAFLEGCRRTAVAAQADIERIEAERAELAKPLRRSFARKTTATRLHEASAAADAATADACEEAARSDLAALRRRTG